MKANRKTMVGRVVSDKMQKTVVVKVESQRPHPLYRRMMRLSRTFKAHDESNECRIGDLVRVEECPPISREKTWRVVQLLQASKLPEVRPQEIGAEVEEGVEARGREE